MSHSYLSQSARLKECPCVDYMVRGEREETLEKFNSNIGYYYGYRN